MNWRAIGCGTLAAAVFVLIGVLGIWRSLAPAECPDRLPYEPAPYHAVGEATDEPMLPDSSSPPERIGSASFGLASWDVYVAPEERPVTANEPLPERIVLDCGNDTFRAFERGGS